VHAAVHKLLSIKRDEKIITPLIKLKLAAFIRGSGTVKKLAGYHREPLQGL
jgi:hypothetical protein